MEEVEKISDYRILNEPIRATDDRKRNRSAGGSSPACCRRIKAEEINFGLRMAYHSGLAREKEYLTRRRKERQEIQKSFILCVPGGLA